MKGLETALETFARHAWSTPLVVLLLGGGLYFLFYSRGLPLRYFGHALKILRGDYDNPNEPGDITHRQALSAALSGTLGLGNLAGVAVAIHMGGPGAIFWMWVSAFVGISTKFFTCTLGVMYRGYDSTGHLQGGPMYVIREGLGRRWQPLAWFFCLAGLLGTLPVFQSNQLTQVVRDMVVIPAGWVDPQGALRFDLGFGLFSAAVVAMVVFGGIDRIGRVAARLVPAMVLLYLVGVVYILAGHVTEIPAALALIVSDAFTGEAASGGVMGAVIATGIRRGAFSNEAGIGTEVMAHGAARTREPVREGLVAMLGPVVDTLIVCTATAMALLLTGVWQGTEANGVTLTAMAFEKAMPGLGGVVTALAVAVFSFSTMFTFWYYGAKCLGYLIGADRQGHYRYFYVALVAVGSVASLDAVVALIDGMYALMAIPTMTATLLLSPKVMAAASDYFRRLQSGQY